MSQDVFEVVALEEIPQLLRVFEKEKSKFYPLNQFVKISCEYKEHKIEVPMQILYRYGDIVNGVYMMQTTFDLGGGVELIYYFVYTALDDLSGVKHALMKTSRIQWEKKNFIFQITFERFASVISEVAKTKGFAYDMKHNYLMWLPEPVGCGNVPEDMYVGKIEETHLTEINENWPHKYPGSEVYLSHQIRNNFGLGLFRKTDNKMVCSAISFHTGGIFVLYTDPEFRGKGCAEIIVRHMASELHNKGRIPFATILLENIPSLKLFTKIGFKHFTKGKHIILSWTGDGYIRHAKVFGNKGRVADISAYGF